MLQNALSLPELELLITNVGFVISTIIIVSTGFVVLLKSSRRDVRIPFFLFTLSYSIFLLSHIAGINASTPELARNIFMLNVSNISTIILVAQWLLAAVNELRNYQKLMNAFCILGAFLFAIFLIFPQDFIAGTEPVLYFPNYYSVGSLYIYLTIYQFIVITSVTYIAWRAYKKARDTEDKRRMFYFFIMPIIGYPIGFAPAITIFFHSFDPIISVFLWAWIIPLGYGVMKNDLLDIRVVAKRALVYLGLVAISTIGLIIVNIASVYLIQHYDNFPIWIVPLIYSFFGVSIALLVWSRVRQSDLLKYEFINVITHKFRTPMTYIKFSIEELRGDTGKEMQTAAIDRIEIANSRLIDLTNVLVEAAQSEESNYGYQREEVSLNKLVEDMLFAQRGDIASKLITIEKKFAPDLRPIIVDSERTKSVLQILLENAVLYSQKGGRVQIETRNEGKRVVLTMQDNGIGMSWDELKLVFNKFYRTQRATNVDTEGMGIGLYIARNIVERQGGKLWATSPGRNLGSTFYLSFPAHNHENPEPKGAL